MCELLCAAPHFNFAENIMGVIVGRLSKRSWDEASSAGDTWGEQDIR
jgi:nucleolar complex protein 3